MLAGGSTIGAGITWGAIIYMPASRCTVHRAPTQGSFAWPAPPHSPAARTESGSLCGTTWPQNRDPAHETLLLFMAQLRSQVASFSVFCWREAAESLRFEGREAKCQEGWELVLQHLWKA